MHLYLVVMCVHTQNTYSKSVKFNTFFFNLLRFTEFIHVFAIIIILFLTLRGMFFFLIPMYLKKFKKDFNLYIPSNLKDLLYCTYGNPEFNVVELERALFWLLKINLLFIF